MQAAASEIRWIVYARPHCGLCEQFMLDLAQLLGVAAEAASVVDITDNEELERKYGTRVPVLMADGDFVCAYKVDKQRIDALLSTV